MLMYQSQHTISVLKTLPRETTDYNRIMQSENTDTVGTRSQKIVANAAQFHKALQAGTKADPQIAKQSSSGKMT